MKTERAVVMAGSGYVITTFILCFSGVYGQTKMICALKGSSVDLPCSADNPSSNSHWYTIHWRGSIVVQKEITAQNYETYTSEENISILAIHDLNESDANTYCCEENPVLCRQTAIQLTVTDLQVRVFPTAEAEAVTLMCTTSCLLTETPIVYIWYQNTEFLYEDWSPWYQELVGSDEGVAYSCAIKGYEDLRAPDVSVDSVTPTYFNVTYAEGKMCLWHRESEDEPCSITHPREVLVERFSLGQQGHVRLVCASSGSPTEPETAHTWYRDRCKHLDSFTHLLRNSSNSSFSCAVKGLEHLASDEVCVVDKNCWTVNYGRRRICNLEGQVVNIVSQYSHPDNQEQTSKVWYKKQSSSDQVEKMVANRRVQYEDQQNQHLLKISSLKTTDSAEYTFRLRRDKQECKGPELPGVTLTVTGLKVTLRPNVATEGQEVTLNCGTSCPLPSNTKYLWYLNGQALTLPESHNKQLVLDPVRFEHAGNYSCLVRMGKRNISSTDSTLTVISGTGTMTLAAAVGSGTALLVAVALTVVWWIHRKKRSSRSQRQTSTKQQNSSPLYENLPAQPTQPDDHQYGTLVFSKDDTPDVYATIEPASST